MEISKNEKTKKSYFEKNREKWNKYQREYKKRKYKEDLAFRLKTKEYQRELYKNRKFRNEN